LQSSCRSRRSPRCCRDRHQQLHATDTVIYGIFADLMRKLDGVSDEVGHLRFIMTDRLLISGRHHALSAMEATRAAIETWFDHSAAKGFVNRRGFC
jgi:hypothetical protein